MLLIRVIVNYDKLLSWTAKKTQKLLLARYGDDFPVTDEFTSLRTSNVQKTRLSRQHVMIWATHRIVPKIMCNTKIKFTNVDVLEA